MASPVAVIMVIGSGVLFAAAWWYVEAVFPRQMVRRTARQVDLHRGAVEALDVALGRAGNDQAQHERLAAQRSWHLAQLSALAPADAEAFAPIELARAA